MNVLVFVRPDAPERQCEVAAQLRAAGISCQFVPRLSPAHTTGLKALQQQRGYDACSRRPPLSSDQIARFASHRLAWGVCAALGEAATVLEEGAEIPRGIAPLLRFIEGKLSRCGLVLLDGAPPPGEALPSGPDRYSVRGLGQPSVAATAYACSPAAAVRLRQGSPCPAASVSDYLLNETRHGQAAYSLSPAAPLRIDPLRDQHGLK